MSGREGLFKAGAGPGIYVQEYNERSTSLSVCRRRSETYVLHELNPIAIVLDEEDQLKSLSEEYKCPRCLRSFVCWTYLQVHMQEHHIHKLVQICQGLTTYAPSSWCTLSLVKQFGIALLQCKELIFADDGATTVPRAKSRGRMVVSEEWACLWE